MDGQLYAHFEVNTPTDEPEYFGPFLLQQVSPGWYQATWEPLHIPDAKTLSVTILTCETSDPLVSDYGGFSPHIQIRPAHGKLTDGFSYIPDPNYVGSDSFTYAYSDDVCGTGFGLPGTVFIIITNPPPLTISKFWQGDAGNGTVPEFFGLNSPSDSGPNSGKSSDPITGRARTSKFGCALCSVATMLTSFQGFESTTPALLDGWLTLGTNLFPDAKKFVGYNPRANLNWTAITTVTRGRVKFLGETTFANDDERVSTFLNEHFCLNSERIILHLSEKINGVATPNGHFVLVTAKAGSDWTVFDPGWHDANLPANLLSLQGHRDGFFPKLNGKLSSVKRIFGVDRAYTFQASDPNNPPMPYLAFYLLCPAELQITDPAGQRLGNTTTFSGSDFMEIPGASYWREFPLGDDSDDSTDVEGENTGIKYAYIPSPIAGFYTVTGTGTDSGSYSLIAQAASTPGNIQGFSMGGTIEENEHFTTNLVVTTAPTISDFSRAGQVLTLSIESKAGFIYSVESNQDLNSTDWLALASLEGTGDTLTFAVTNSTSFAFYRISVIAGISDPRLSLAGYSVYFLQASSGLGAQLRFLLHGDSVISDAELPPNDVGTYSFVSAGSNKARLSVDFPNGDNYRLTLTFTDVTDGNFTGSMYYDGADQPVDPGSTFSVNAP